jgi:cation:H+ antiporter
MSRARPSGVRYLIRSAVPFMPFAVIGAGLLLMPGDVGHLGQCALGFVLLLLGGQWLVEGAVVIAQRMGWSPLLIGMTIVAFGTSAPELVFNLVAASNHNTDLSFGNIVGSNITNIALVLGLAAVISPIAISSRIIVKELPWLIVVSVVFTVLAFAPPQVDVMDVPTPGWSRWTGITLLTLFAGFMIAWLRLARSERRDRLTDDVRAVIVQETKEVESLALAVILFVLGLVLLLGGGSVSEQGAVGVARWLGLSQAIIGLTVVALATSLPEVVTSAVASFKGQKDLAIGNVVGSNMFNIMLIMGATVLVRPVPVPQPWGWWDLGVMIGLTIVLVPLAALFSKKINRIEGGFLLAVYVAYIGFTVLREVYAITP